MILDDLGFPRKTLHGELGCFLVYNITQNGGTGYNGPIILEVAMGDEKYKKVSGENFVKKAVKNAKKLAKMYDKM